MSREEMWSNMKPSCGTHSLLMTIKIMDFNVALQQLKQTYGTLYIQFSFAEVAVNRFWGVMINVLVLRGLMADNICILIAF